MSCKCAHVRNDQLELIIELVIGLLEEEGFKTVRYSETKRHSTTEYDCLVIQDANGEEFSVGFNKSMVYNRKTGRWERTNIVGEVEG